MELRKRIKTILSEYKSSAYSQINEIDWEGEFSDVKQRCINPKDILRWNDSGDFFANRYVKIAENVINRLQNEGFNVDSYAYTKQADVAKNASFETTFSMDANKRELSKIDLEKQKIQMTVPKELFKDLNLLKYDDEKILKNRIAKHYDFDPNRIITYDELMLTPKVNYPKWIVVVSPKDGDDAATRRDVLKVLTLFH
jgi:hypothetical protein